MTAELQLIRAMIGDLPEWRQAMIQAHASEFRRMIRDDKHVGYAIALVFAELESHAQDCAEKDHCPS